jgi:hypothetical protein
MQFLPRRSSKSGRTETDGQFLRQGVAANILKLHRNGAVGFIDWLDAFIRHSFID